MGVALGLPGDTSPGAVGLCEPVVRQGGQAGSPASRALGRAGRQGVGGWSEREGMARSHVPPGGRRARPAEPLSLAAVGRADVSFRWCGVALMEEEEGGEAGGWGAPTLRCREP